ncbi:MAG: pectin acetylesterase-family hydrolase, partial [Polyangiales bacterium]
MPSRSIGRAVVVLSFPLALGIAGCSSGSSSGNGGAGGTGPKSCAEAASDGVRACVDLVNAAWGTCYADNNAPCASDDENIGAALSQLQTDIEESCTDAEFLSLSVDALVGRLQNSCRSEADSISWRTFGGPQGAVYPTASGSDKSCLRSAHGAASALIDRTLGVIGDCLNGDTCDAATVEAERQNLADMAVAEVEDACGDTKLEELIAVDPRTYVDRAVQQIDCITATSHATTSPLTLSCGPSNTDFEAPRGEWKRIVVDGDKWGTVCGDGSAYSFWVKLAPEGEPLDRVVVGLQGGGVCALEPQCADRIVSNPGLFTAMDDEPYSTGMMSEDPEVSPFATWTQVWLPYCNQDVFAGGGVIEYPGTLDLPRYGAINLRSAVRMVRDVIWKEMDEAGGAGFRPDELVALFGGWSAGGYGALYNYHWFLDDLLWPRTAAFPDASGALDNERPFGVALLGEVKIPADGWNMLPYLPPYCFEGRCAVGPVLYNAISPRLKQVSEQQMLILSNPYDDTQRRDAFFTGPGEPSEEVWRAIWINTMRSDYCDTKDLNGI